MSRYLSSPAVAEADMGLNLGLAGLVGPSGARDARGEVLARKAGLDPTQAEAVSALSGTHRLEVVIGPAGTGKTTMLAVARSRLEHQGRHLVLVAPTPKPRKWRPRKSAPRGRRSPSSCTTTAGAGTPKAAGAASNPVRWISPPASPSGAHKRPPGSLVPQ